MRYTRPLSVCSETRLSPSFLRMTPARKPRTECCCQSVTAMIAAIVALVGTRSIAIMRACLVSGPAADLDDAGSDRLRTGLADFRAAERFAAFGLVLGLVIGSSEVYAAPSAAPPQPRLGNFTRQGRTLKRALAPPSHHSNAPIKPESQSILSKIIALTPSKGSLRKSFNASSALSFVRLIT